MKKVCVISLAGIDDSRAIRSIETMLSMSGMEIHYFFTEGERDKTSSLRNRENLNLYPISRPKYSFKRQFFNHSFAYLSADYFLNEIQKIKNDYDVIYAHDFRTSYSALKLKRSNTKLIYDVHDLYIETINQHFPIRAKFHKKIIYKFLIYFMRFVCYRWEKKFMKSVDLVLTTNENYKNYLIEKYGNKNITITSNYPKYKNVQHSNQIYFDLKIDLDKKIVLYHGAFTEGRFLREIVSSSKYFNKNIVLVLIGNGPMENELKKSLQDSSNIVFKDLVPYNELLNFISGATLGLMLIDPINLSKKYSLANKVTEYMASGLPVVASNSPENVRIINGFSSGYILDEINEKTISDLINNLIDNNSDELAKKGENGKSAIRDYLNWEKVSEELKTEIIKLLN